MKFEKEIATACEYGKQAAIAGKGYDAVENVEELSHLYSQYSIDERIECGHLLRKAWRESYETESRQFKVAGEITVPSILMKHKHIQTDSEHADDYVYWNWMDKMTPVAAAIEAAAGHWSTYQTEFYLAKHASQRDVFNKVYKLLKADECNSVCIMGLLREAISSGS